MKSGLEKDNLRVFISVLFEGNAIGKRKILATIEDDKILLSHTFIGDCAYHDAKKWIKDNL